MATKYAAVIENTRALAKVVLVDSVSPIKKADNLELAHVGGWQCVVKKGEFVTGQKAVYIEIDSLLPVAYDAFSFLAARTEGLKTFDDIVYARIRSIKLRGELSQGLLIPVPSEFAKSPVDTNLTNKLGIRKFDEIILNNDGLDGRLNAENPTLLDRFIKWIAGKPAPSQYKPWPYQLSKSDQERVQNIGNAYASAAYKGEMFEETVKLDGMSMTIYEYSDGSDKPNRSGVCSRNYDLSLEDIEFTKEQVIRRFVAQNLFALVSGFKAIPRTIKHLVAQVHKKGMPVKDAIKEFVCKKYFWFTGPVFVIKARTEKPVDYIFTSGLLSKLNYYNKVTNDTITIQGELVGPDIARNYEKNNQVEFFMYQAYRNGQQWVSPQEARQIATALDVKYVPVLHESTTLPASVKEVLKRATGKGALNPEVDREGIVFKSLTRNFSFKVISNDYLLKKEKSLDE